MVYDGFVYVWKLEHGRWHIGFAQYDRDMYAELGACILIPRTPGRYAYIKDYPVLEVAEQRRYCSEQHPAAFVDQVVREYMKRYGAEYVRGGSYELTDKIPAHFYALFPVPNPNMKYK